MNILFITTTLFRFSFDSQSSFVLDQAVAWKKKRPLDSLTILAPHDILAKEREIYGSINIVRFKYFWPISLQKLCYPAILPNLKRNPLLYLELPFFMMFEIISIYRLINRSKADIIYAHWVIPNGVSSFIALKLLAIKRHFFNDKQKLPKLVLQNHSSDLLFLIKIPLFGKSLAKRIIQKAHALFCVNKRLYNLALNLFELKEKTKIKEKIFVLPMGFNLEIKKSTDEKKYDFGFIGRLTEKKGLTHLLRAFSKLKGKATLAIAGEGELKNELLRKIDMFSLNQRVVFLGNLSGKSKTNFFENTKVFVFPSLSIKNDIEGMPVALFEALSSGSLVVASNATNIGLLPEWNKIKETVYLLNNPMNSSEFARILETANKTNLYELVSIINTRQKIIQKYSWDLLINNYLKNLI